MATFSSKPVEVKSPATEVAEKFSDLTRLQQFIDAMPPEERAKVGDVSLTADSIIMKTPQVGEITLKITKRSPERIVMEAVGSPVPMNIVLNIKPVSDNSSELTTAMEVDIPAFLKPMVGGTMQKAVDQFSELMKRFV